MPAWGPSAQVPPASWPRCQHLLGYCGQVASPSLHVALPAPGDLSLLRTVAHASLSFCPPSARDHPPSCSGVGASPAHPCSPPAGHVLSPLLSFAVSQPGCHPLLPVPVSRLSLAPGRGCSSSASWVWTCSREAHPSSGLCRHLSGGTSCPGAFLVTSHHTRGALCRQEFTVFPEPASLRCPVCCSGAEPPSPHPPGRQCLLFLPWAMAVSWCSRGCCCSLFSHPRWPPGLPTPIVSTQGAPFAWRHVCCLSPALACELLETRGGPGSLGAFSRACVWLGGGLAASSRPLAPVRGRYPLSLLSAVPLFRWLLGLGEAALRGSKGPISFRSPAATPLAGRVSLESGSARSREIVWGGLAGLTGMASCHLRPLFLAQVPPWGGPHAPWTGLWFLCGDSPHTHGWACGEQRRSSPMGRHYH